ncbi:MAG TPA: hypothetical protein VHS97_16940, partial [Isosphaeraceae bacterium]|nr:hypothetical protein [Isosphaeraceae bacterium]
MTIISRFGRPAVVAGLIFSIGISASAQQKTPVPSFTGERVIVADVPDRYGVLADQIKRLEKSSPQSYYVVVVKSTGTGPWATRLYADELLESWERQRSKRSQSFDPDRSVVIVVALENEQVAVKPGAFLRNELGLDRDRVERDLLKAKGGFLDLAKENRYTDAISTLLTSTNNWIAGRDSRTSYAPVQITAAKTPGSARPAQTTTTPPAILPNTSSNQPVERDQPAERDRSSTQTPIAPLKQASSDWLPVVLVGIPVLLIALAIIAGVWLTFRRNQNRVAGRIKEIKSKAVDVMDRLDSLKERLKLMPTSTDFKQPMTGETQRLYNTVNEKLGTLWDGWLHVMEVLEKAQKLAARSGSPLSQKTLAEAEELITKQGSFEAIEKQAQSITVDVDKLDHAHQEARTVLAVVTLTRPKIDTRLDEIKKLRLATAPYQDELSGVDAGMKEAGTVLVADPLGTMTVLEQLRTRSDALAGRLERVVAIFGDAQKAKSALDTLKRQVAGHRAQGLNLREEGANPDQFLGQGEQSQAETVAALEAGDPQAAAGKLETATSLTNEAQATIEKVQKARALCERDLPARARETDRLRAALPQAESYQNDLERDFARSSWQAVSRNLDQARALVATFDDQARQAAAAATISRQDYVKGAAMVEELARQQQIVLRLMSGLGEQLNALINVRNECRKLNEDLAARERQAELLIGQNDSIVSDVARNSLESARRTKGEIQARSGEPRPDWPALRQSLLEVIDDLALAQSQAEEDLKYHQSLTQEFAQVRNSASRVYAFLASHQEDRLAANQHYQAAADALERVGMEITEPRGRSAVLLEQVRGAAADLKISEGLAREDIRLAAQAQTEITEAGR